MSGIVAMLAHGDVPLDRELLSAMTAAQRFRGPDGYATWRAGSIGLGHTLHKTVPEAEQEQPVTLGGQLFITADARVDARDELSARLRARGHAVAHDASDAMLLLTAYAAWGEGLFEQVLGDFSFALWDAPRRRLLCAVDHMGVKPFYYANRGALFVGSNTLAVVRLHPKVRSDLNEAAVGDFLSLGCYHDRDATIYSDIARIPSGHFMIVEAGEVRVQQYFTLTQPPEMRFVHQDDCVEQFQDLLARAVRDRVRASRVAVYMSGGVDSPLIAAVAVQQLRQHFSSCEVEAFTCVYDDLIPDDERRYAAQVGERLGIPVDFQALDDADLFDWTGHRVPSEPVHGSVVRPIFEQTARLAARFSTVLTGLDGDALMGAAPRLHWPARLRQRAYGAVARDIAWYISNRRALPPIGLRTGITHLTRDRSEASRPLWVRADFWTRADLSRRWAWARTSPPFEHPRAPSLAAFALPMWPRIFDRHDAGSLGVALEVRHPLMDLRVIRFACSLPAVPWCVDKYLLRRCLKNLPDSVRVRPKTPVRGNPDLQRLRVRGLGNAAHLWHRSSALRELIDIAGAQRALEAEHLPENQLHPLLRAVALGLWLDAQGAPRSAA